MDRFAGLKALSVSARIRWGAGAGARLGAYFALLTGVVVAFGSRDASRPLSPITIAGAILVGFVLAGVVFGLTRPRVRDGHGAALVGAGCILPILAAVRLSVGGVGEFGPRTALGLGVVSMLLGGFLGVAAWRGWTRSAGS